MEFGTDEAREFIASVRWQYAKTMPDWPHEYTVKDWRTDLVAQFEGFCRLIESKGFVEPWPPPPSRAIYHNRYFVIDGHKYWAMGPRGDHDPPERKDIINRAIYGEHGST